MKKILKITKVIIDIVIYFIIAILALYVLLIGYHKFVKKSNLISIGDYYIFQIVSGSMESNYHVGDCIVAKKTDEYKVGDVITYEVDNNYITHRIYAVTGDSVITKGDANITVDDAVKKDDIVGKVLFKLTVLTFIIKYKFVIIGIIIMLYLLQQIIDKLKKEE